VLDEGNKVGGLRAGRLLTLGDGVVHGPREGAGGVSQGGGVSRGGGTVENIGRHSRWKTGSCHGGYGTGAGLVDDEKETGKHNGTRLNGIYGSRGKGGRD